MDIAIAVKETMVAAFDNGGVNKAEFIAELEGMVEQMVEQNGYAPSWSMCNVWDTYRRESGGWTGWQKKVCSIFSNRQDQDFWFQAYAKPGGRPGIMLFLCVDA